MASSESCLRNKLEARLRFEQIISELSAQFIHLPSERLDDEIELALKKVLEFFQVDRCALLHVLPDKNSWKISYLASSEHAPPIPKGTELPQSIHPWAYEKLAIKGEVVSFERVEDMPDEARVDKQTWVDWGIRSNLVIPILKSEPLVHVIAINSVQREYVWPEEYIPRLRLLGEILINALQLSQTRQELEERLRFEGLISDLSAAFVSISYKDVKGEIHKWLQRITEFFDVDRCTLGIFSEDGTQLQPAFEYYLKGVEPAPVSISKEKFSWYVSQLMEAKLVVINRLEDMPAEAEAERRLLLAKKIKSLLSVPMVDERGTLGSCVLVSEHAERIWPLNLVKRMRIIAQVFANAIARNRWELMLRESEARLNMATDAAGVGVWALEIDTGYLWASVKARELFHFILDEELNYKRLFEVIHPSDRQRVEHAIQTAVKSGERTRCEYRVVDPDGTVRWIVSIGNRISDPNRKSFRVMGVSIDSSERKAMEELLHTQLAEIKDLKQKLEKENIFLRKEIEVQHLHKEIVSRSPAMQRILVQVEQVAPTDATVLIEGETGTGKELLARAIHRLSGRKSRPLVTVNCAALPPSLVESELFGREKGAYTGALTRMAGRFEVADGATLFLDEIGELPFDVQAKLLRVLEQGRFERLGSSQSMRADVRIIAATNQDLTRQVAAGRFRNDLYYRLNVFPIKLPPLRERPEDIPPLVMAFLKQYENKMGKRIDRIPRPCMDNLQRYAWPGNIRELRNVIERALIVASGTTLEVRLPGGAVAEIPEELDLEAVERRHIIDVLQKTDWRLSGQGGAAEILGLKRTSLYSKMKKLGIRRPQVNV